MPNEVDKKLQKKAEKREEKGLALKAKSERLKALALAEKNAKKRAKLFVKMEKLQTRANKKLVRSKQYADRAEGKINDKEWARMGKSRRNHWFYDRISAVVSAFRPKNPLRQAEMSFERDGNTFENKGRIFLGGTKAMNLFRDGAGREWLCKEAVTCVGTAKPMGALVTEAASKLQSVISPETAVQSFVYRDAKGAVCGSLQERLDIPKDSFDLFKWQTQTDRPLPEGMTSQILREHVADWLLCNFDTKGENFLIDSEGRLRGIDKEQALSYLDKEETRHMSYTYAPNPNKTLYNSIFELYAQGKIDLDLSAVEPYVEKVTSMTDEKYMEIFEPVVKQKCGGDKAKMQKMTERILERKNGLREEYQRFFGGLQQERAASLGTATKGVATAGERGAEKTAEKYHKPISLSDQIKSPKVQTAQKAKEKAPKEKSKDEIVRE